MSKKLRRVCVALTLAAVLGAALSGTAFADTADIVVFADANLEAALRALPGADADASGALTEGEMAALTGTLDLSGLDISDITGLQYAAGISGLNLSGNLIRDISALGSFSSIAINVSGNCLDIAAGSGDMAVIAALQAAGCTVTYSPQKTRVTGVSLNLETLELSVGETAVLTAAVLPENATVQTVVWSSDNDEVAYIEEGSVEAAGEGTAHITAKTLDGGFEAECTVTVSSDRIRSSKYTVGADTVSGVAKYTGIEAFKDNLENDSDEISVYKANGAQLISGTIGTGMSVVLTTGGLESDRLTIVVTGDTNGDGLISISDYTLTRYQILALQPLEGAYCLAGDVNGDGSVSISDYTLIRYDILGLKPISESPVWIPDLPEVSDARIRLMIQIALAQLNDPYVRGEEGPDAFDCSGLAYYCIRQSGYTGTLWRSTANSYSRWSSWQYVDKNALQPGDLMFFFSDDPNDGDHIGHVGIYLGNNYLVHASSSNSRVVISQMKGWYWTMLSHGRRVYY
jgi:hypothetical protein